MVTVAQHQVIDATELYTHKMVKMVPKRAISLPRAYADGSQALTGRTDPGQSANSAAEAGGSAPPAGRRVLQSEPYERHPSVQLCPALSSSVQPLRAPTTRAGAAWRTPSLAGGHLALPISIVSLAAAGPCPLFYHSLPTVKASQDPIHVEGTTPSSPSMTSGGSRDAPPRWTPPAGPQQRAEGLLSRLLSRRLLSRSYLLCP